MKGIKWSSIKYVLALLLFGLNGIVASYIHLSSYEIVLIRTCLGSLLLMLLFFFTKNKLTIFQYKRQFLFLMGSGIAMGTSWMFLYEAYQQIGVSMASLAYYCGPVIVMVLSPLIFKERLTWVKGIGFISVLIGIFLVNGQALEVGEKGFGLFCGIMSALMYAMMVIFNKKAYPMKGLENAMTQLVMSFLTVAVFVGFKQGFAIEVASSDLLPILILGLLNTGIGCYLYFSSIGDLPVQTVAICGYLEPLSAVVFSALLLKEMLLPMQIVGAVCILGGAVFGEFFMVKEKS